MSYSQSEADLLKQLADAQATVEALRAQVKELLEALDCVLGERPLPSGEYVHRVSCNGDRRKPAGTVGITCSCRVGQQQVEALRRERKQDEQKHLQDVAYMRSQYDSIVAMKDEVQAAFDDEREKAKGLEGRYRRAYGRAANAEQAVTELKTELSQLQALVRAWGTAHESVDDWFRRAATDENTPTISEFEAVKKVLFDSERALKATLDATTPATKGGDGE